jgi:hypothetical protein
VPQGRRKASGPPSAAAGTPRLSPDRAFVLQLEAGAAHPTRRLLRGRVEHLVSGEALRFASLTELVGFLNRFR